MAITPICDKCKKKLTQFGGLLFGSPNNKGYVKKWHLCKKCYKLLTNSFKKSKAHIKR